VYEDEKEEENKYNEEVIIIAFKKKKVKIHWSKYHLIRFIPQQMYSFFCAWGWVSVPSEIAP
jgi:hypothetical protein